MIYCDSFENMGRLGNHIMRLMTLISFARKYDVEFFISSWKYADCFDWTVPIKAGRALDATISEPAFHYTPEYYDKLPFKDQNINLQGWFQSYKYWDPVKEEILEKLTFKQEFINPLLDAYKPCFDKPTIAISIRRGDFVGNVNYYQLPVLYYILALLENFPDWRDRNLLIFSDDINYCRIHFQCLENVYFAAGTDIEQLALMTRCDDYIISNSTFSYCGAYLSRNRGAKVVRPKFNFAGPLAERKSEKDYWPESWIKFEHEGKKIDLKDVTFTIPVLMDSTDRKQNLNLSVCLLQRDFDTNVIVGEQGGDKFQYMSKWCRYINFDTKEFHRTMMLNEMALASETPIVANWDADNVIPPLQIYEAVEQIRRGADMAYPFDGRSARVPRHPNFKNLEKHLDAGILQGDYKGLDKYNSVGHAVFFDKESFINGGMENENFISFGPEDIERFERFKRLGYNPRRIAGPVFHIDHAIGINSSTSNPHFAANWKELEKIRGMGDEELFNYVASWPWFVKYSAGYYETISENAIRSRDEIFTFLKNICSFETVIDIGCGIGEWGFEIDKFGVEKYIGVDHKIPKKKLLIPEERFIDHDLIDGSDFPLDCKFDLALCLEVLEHIPEENSEKAIDLLCSLSDQILFSAAIPYQGGRHHVNEQWQSWWAKKFEDRGYHPENVRDILSHNDSIDIWYRNNVVLYKKEQTGQHVTDFVHPRLFENLMQHYQAEKDAGLSLGKQ
jgi:SAM-dependent methyltransferase